MGQNPNSTESKPSIDVTKHWSEVLWSNNCGGLPSWLLQDLDIIDVTAYAHWLGGYSHRGNKLGAYRGHEGDFWILRYDLQVKKYSLEFAGSNVLEFLQVWNSTMRREETKMAKKPATNRKRKQQPVTKPEPKLIPMYKVIVLNDDTNSQDYVALTLIKIFKFSQGEAVMVMNEAHKKGRALCVIHPFELAELRTQQLRAAGLGAEMEPA